MDEQIQTIQRLGYNNNKTTLQKHLNEQKIAHCDIELEEILRMSQLRWEDNKGLV